MTNSGNITFIDNYILDQPGKAELLEIAKDALHKHPEGKKLLITIDATHSGMLTNHRVYPGVHVEHSYRSFFSRDKGGTSDYDKPILKHHDDKDDPIGRVVGAEFIKFKSGNDFIRDFLFPDMPDKGGKGSGVVRVRAEITDAEAIEKILDGRLLSVSQGSIPEQMTCSVCGKDLMPPLMMFFGGGEDNEQYCDHIPGKKYEVDSGEVVECYAITGRLEYKELSFVNIPAQPPAKVVAIDQLWEKAKLEDSQVKIPSMFRTKKSAVSSMVLTDSDGSELDLLTKKKSGRIYVPASSADSVFNSVISGVDIRPDDGPQKADVDTHHGASDNGKTTCSCGVDRVRQKRDTGQCPDVGTASDDDVSRPDIDSNGDYDKMADSDKNQDISVEALKSSIESLTDQKKQLEDQLAEMSDEIKTLRAKLADKEEEVERLTDEMASAQSDLAKDYAFLLTHYRIMLKKPTVADIDSQEALEEYVGELAKRSPESLRDALVDIVQEFKHQKVDDTAGAQKLMGDPKVVDDNLPNLNDRDYDADFLDQILS